MDACFRGFAGGRFEPGKQLGKGDVGVTFEVASDPAHLAVKRVRLSTVESRKQFVAEITTQQALGLLGVCPRVYAYWICETQRPRTPARKRRRRAEHSSAAAAAEASLYGFYVMDRLSFVYRDLFPDGFDGLPCVNPPVKIQHAVIRLIAMMVKSGFSHNDLHPGNIGFDMQGCAVLFDFGFVRSVSDDCIRADEASQFAMLGFSLCQIIEHNRRDIKYASEFYNCIYQLRQSVFQWPTDMRRDQPGWFAAPATALKILRGSREKSLRQAAAASRAAARRR